MKVGSAATIATNGNATYSGIVTAANFVGGGANITALSGSNIASGTVAAARVATLNQDTTGNAATATILETTRAIGGVNFNGSAAINLPGVNESGNQNTSGTAAGLSGSPTITVAKVNVGTAATIHSTGGITAGIVTATSFVGPLTGNVTGNASGSSGSCTGNAATATILATARNIGGVSFDGSAAINLPGVNTAGDQDTTGTATNATNVTAADESSDTTCFPLFVTAATGNLPPKTGSNLSFNSSSGALTATSFSGDGSNLTGTGPQEADTSVSSTSATTVLSVAHASYRGSFVKVLITQGSAYQMGNYTIIHDGTTASIIEESAIATGSMLGTFSATISGINLLMQVTMGSSSSATVTVKADNITV